MNCTQIFSRLLWGLVVCLLSYFCTPSLFAKNQSNTDSSSNLAETAPPQGPSDIASYQLESAALKSEALAVAKQFIQKYPDDPLSYALLGSAYYNIGQADNAAVHLKRSLELSPNQADIYEIQARIAYEKGDPEESIRLYHETLRRGPADPDILNRLGKAQLDLGQTAQAQSTFRQAVQLPDAPSQSHFLLGQSLLQAGDYSSARLSFLQATQQTPDHTQAFFGLFTASMRLGQTNEGRQYQKEFIRLESIDRQSLTDRSSQKDTLTGLPFVRETVARTLAGAAQLYRSHAQLDEATRLLLKAALLDGSTPSYRAALESIYLQRQQTNEGLSTFLSLLQSNPANYLNHLFLGRFQVKAVQLAAAEISFKKVQQLAPNLPEGYRALGELYLKSPTQFPNSIAQFQNLVALHPTGPHFYLLALACAKNSDKQNALDAINAALQKNPTEARYQKLKSLIQKHD